MLYYEAVDLKILELLRRLQRLPVLSDTRLVGGTALAMQIGHRRSVDIDLFGKLNDDYIEIEEALRSEGDFKILI